MAEPWLDSLSEDWTSQPRSSPGSLPSFGTPSASTRSRIPRHAQRSSKPSSLRQPNCTSSPGAGKSILSERSISDINIPPHSSSMSSPVKPAARERALTTSSASSTGSVVKDSSVLRKSRSSSPNKSKGSAGTPEWKKLVAKGKMAQSDLFATKPLGLQGIFQKPPDTPGEESSPVRSSFTFFQGLDSMPSSPPPWPKDHKGAQMTFRRTQAPASEGFLHTVLEEGDDGEHENNLPEMVEEQQPPSESQQKSDPGPREAQHLPTSQQKPGMRWTPQDDGSSELLSSSDRGLERDDQPAAAQSSHGPSGNVQRESFSRGRVVSTATKSSSSTAGFSPVFISKHNTVDGRVDYAAVDVSDPQTLEFVSSHVTAEEAPQDDRDHDGTQAPEESVYATPAARPLHFSSSQSEKSTHLPQISPFVDTRRGGYADDSSFMRRPLSSSAYSSVVPSDSISQSGMTRRSDARSRGSAPFFKAEDEEVDNLAAQCPGEHVSVSSTTAVDDKEPLDHERQGSRGTNTDREDILAEGHVVIQDIGASDDDSGTAPSVETTFRRSDGRMQQLTAVVASDRPTTPASQMVVPSVQDQQHKRQNSTSTRGPTPKRIRTLTALDMPMEKSEHVSDTIQEQHRRMQAVIGKRKDARYESAEKRIDPEVLARRAILRPRNPTPGQQQQPRADFDQDVDESIRSDLEDVQEQIDRFPLPASAEEDHAEIRMLASQVATVRITHVRRTSEQVRKPSICTNDFVHEAMMIMDFIRSRPPGHDQLPNIEESEAEELGDDFQLEGSMHTISRPPSREGVITPWRSRDGRPLDPRVVSHLKQYQETGDETFLMSSVLESMQLEEAEDERQQNEPEDDDPQHISIRIIEPKDGSPSGSPVKTHFSHESTDSACTVQTTNSQRSRTVPNIPPAKVHHLLQTESSGMRFDERKNTWVKTKKPRKSADVSSSTGTEDDPFMNIPDLRSNEHSEVQHRPLAPEIPTTPLGPGLINDKDLANHPFGSDQGQEMNPDREEAEVRSTLPASPVHDEQPVAEDLSEVDGYDSVVSEESRSDAQRRSLGHSKQPLAKLPIGSVRSRRSEHTVTFSSRPRAWRGSDGGRANTEEESVAYVEVHQAHARKASADGVDNSLVVSKRGQQQTLFRQDQHFENQEICFTRTRADGRTMSLTLSMSTPLPVARSRQMIPSSGLRSNLWQTMSPLSDFSLHQDDRRHLQSRHFDPGHDQQVVSLGSHVQAPAVVSTLVTEITNAQPDEPYWEFVEELDLLGKGLDTLHMLDELCPKLESLNAAQNKLKHLEGAPASIRRMSVSQNQLSSLTAWAHLANLQYLDISGNGLEDVEALRGLIHLRTLTADNNRINDIEGLFDLDGLLSVSLRGNGLKEVDFSSARLSRLSKVDLSDNALHSVRGLHCLPALEHLNLGNNLLSTFPSEHQLAEPCSKLRRLDFSNNSLTTIDSSRLPALHHLDVDSNKLTSVSGIEFLTNLQSLSIRSQTTDADAKSTLASNLSTFSEIHHLYLSGNDLSTLPSALTSTTSFLNTRTLELALCSISTLPKDFASIFPNLRSLNLNFNALRDLPPLRGIRKLKSLHVAGNRISRLRRTVAVLSTLGSTLEELDLRENPLVQGFYPPASLGTSVLDVAPSAQPTTTATDTAPAHPQSHREMVLQHILPTSNVGASDASVYLSRLDEDTRLRRRVYEILLLALCPTSRVVDGRNWEKERERVLKRDGDWERLVGCGVLECVAGEAAGT